MVDRTMALVRLQRTDEFIIDVFAENCKYLYFQFCLDGLVSELDISRRISAAHARLLGIIAEWSPKANALASEGFNWQQKC